LVAVLFALDVYAIMTLFWLVIDRVLNRDGRCTLDRALRSAWAFGELAVLQAWHDRAPDADA
jgi:hypothetical protein